MVTIPRVLPEITPSLACIAHKSSETCERANPSRRDTLSSPSHAIKHGFNLVCGDRVVESVVPKLSIRENLFLNPVAAG
jgi:ABC-type sugar transport system ATPase subunit